MLRNNFSNISFFSFIVIRLKTLRVKLRLKLVSNILRQFWRHFIKIIITRLRCSNRSRIPLLIQVLTRYFCNSLLLVLFGFNVVLIIGTDDTLLHDNNILIRNIDVRKHDTRLHQAILFEAQISRFQQRLQHLTRTSTHVEIANAYILSLVFAFQLKPRNSIIGIFN